MTAFARSLEADTALGAARQENVAAIGLRLESAEPAPPLQGSAPLPAATSFTGDVGASIRAIEHAGSFINALSFKMRTYEKIIRGLNKTLAEHRASEENAYQRAAKAEARAKDAEEQIERLERRELAAQEHLDRAMKAVDTSFFLQPGSSARGAFSRV